jgi:alpha-methylacyl-CoA racemase
MTDSSDEASRSGPLSGLRVVAMGGIGPAPYGVMLLADLGADVVRIDRPPPSAPPADDPFAMGFDPFSRGQRSIVLDLKAPSDVAVVWKLIARADVLVEGFRPGVMERLGFGPEPCHAVNAGLVYGRVTGWGQQGPLAQAPGHDINYIGLTGALDAIGRRGEPPAVPLNLVGDFGGGGMYLAFGVLAALFERGRSGKGQVIDAAMVDGSLSMMTMAYALRASGLAPNGRGANLLDGGAHLYDTCKDGKRVAVGAIERPFYDALRDRLGLDDAQPEQRFTPARWETLRPAMARIFGARDREEWASSPDAALACVSPVLTMDEAPDHPHLKARQSFIEVEGLTMPAPGPRFSRTPAQPPRRFARAGCDSDAIRKELD